MNIALQLLLHLLYSLFPKKASILCKLIRYSSSPARAERII